MQQPEWFPPTRANTRNSAEKIRTVTRFFTVIPFLADNLFTTASSSRQADRLTLHLLFDTIRLGDANRDLSCRAAQLKSACAKAQVSRIEPSPAQRNEYETEGSPSRRIPDDGRKQLLLRHDRLRHAGRKSGRTGSSGTFTKMQDFSRRPMRRSPA